MPAKTPRQEWLRYQTEATHESRRRLPKEASAEEALCDWYGDEEGSLEVAARQAPPKNLDELLPAIMRGLATPEARVMLDLQERWPALVGADWVNHCAPQRIADRTLFVEVDDPAWRYKLQRQIPELLKRVRQVAPVITLLRLVPGGRSLRGPGRPQG